MRESLLSPRSQIQSSIYESSTTGITKIRTITLLDIMKEQVGDVLDPKFIKHHRKELETYVYEFEIRNKYRKWVIIKRLAEFVELEVSLKKRYQDQIPCIPIKEQTEINETNCEQMLLFFQIFLAALIGNKDIQKEKCFLRFSQNFLPQQRKKMKVFKQLEMKKQYGGRHTESVIQRTLCYFMSWSQRFFTITSEGVYYTNQDDSFEIKQMISFSSNFGLTYGQAMTGITYGIAINASQRILNIDAVNIFNMVFFVYFLRKAMSQSDLLNTKRFSSYASIRENCTSSYYIDSKYYFQDLYEALMHAKRQVFITGWMISPYFFLKRPDPLEKTRFDRVLNQVANKGVHINIIVYRQPKMALSINSQFTQDHLHGFNKNIKVLRHPAYLLIPFLWSHHEKMVIIDQKLAFLGGLDIGYGRWDDQSHRLVDLNQETWPGVDYVNYRIKDILLPTKYHQCTLDRRVNPRMPWHDIAIRIKGNSVIDLSRHFVQYWNYVNFQLSIDDRSLLLYAGVHQDLDFQGPTGVWHSFASKKVNILAFQKSQVEASNQVHPINITNMASFRKRASTIQTIDHQYVILDDHAQELQFYATHLKEKSGSDKIDQLLKKLNPKNIFSKDNTNSSNQELIVTVTKKSTEDCEGNQKHQLVRSASMWGLGLEENHQERSIMNAYVQLIDNAKQFIYIENQFFISVENPVANAIKDRIIKAYEKGNAFRVVVVLPALPGFDGELEHENSGIVRVTLHHMFQTICRGQRSILQQLGHIKNLDQYIQFFNLRTHAKIMGTPVTQIIYVHSKLMIVDDKIALIGSANINDRSLLGSRDSEIGIVVEDQEVLKIDLNNKEQREVCSFAHNLRKQLYKEHFGLSDQEARDFMNNDVWWSILESAHKNHEIYRQIFGCYPDNSIVRFEGIFKLKEMANLQKYNQLSQLIKGNAIAFQRHFLQNEDLTIKPGQKEYFLPAINFN